MELYYPSIFHFKLNYGTISVSNREKIEKSKFKSVPLVGQPFLFSNYI